MSDVPAQDLAAEESILGAMMLSDNAASKALDILQPDHFYRESHGLLYKTMQGMSEAGMPLDVVTVSAHAKESGTLEAIGGEVRVYELAGLVPATANIGHYARLVVDAATKRLVERSITDIVNRLETMSAAEAVTALDAAALGVEESTAQKHGRIADIKDLISAKRYALKHPEYEKPGVPSPFSFLPQLMPGRLYVFSGYTGDGKTCGALQFASGACEAGENVGFASAEMSKKDLFDRWICQKTGLDYWRVSHPRLLSLSEQRVLNEAMNVMEPWRVKVIDDELLDIGRLRRDQRVGKFDLLIVDHLHRMRWKDRHDLENKVRDITNIAREFEVPVLLLVQLSRAGDFSHPFPVPSMRQLRETAILEQEASAVWFVYRERDEQHVQTSRSQFIVAKNRYGRVGTEALWFNDGAQAFEENHWEAFPVEEEETVDASLVQF